MNKDDATTPAIRRALLAQGWTVERIQRVPGPGLKGVPDLLVGAEGFNILLEAKSPGEQLTNDQPEWHARWQGQVGVASSADEAVALVRSVIASYRPARAA